jgi:regulator of protease activity HflC (stomatin/prohibitin superfamily)
LAEAEAESKRLQGEGVAAQRKAILHGLQEGVEDLSKAIGVAADETMKYTMLTQYFDMLRDVGTSPNKATVFIPHSPGSLNDFQSQIRSAMMEASAVSSNK